MSIASDLREAARAHSTVTLILDEAPPVTGQLWDHPVVPDLYIVRSAPRTLRKIGAQTGIHPADVLDVIFE